VARKYRGRAEFVFVYCSEAHPDTTGPPAADLEHAELDESLCLPQTATWQERAERAAWFARRTHSARRILVDEFGEDSIQQKYRGSLDLTVVIDVQGRIAFKKEATAEALDRFLHQFLSRTSAATPGPPPYQVASAAVPSRQFPGRAETAASQRFFGTAGIGFVPVRVGRSGRM
jgi:hypothetical protein